MRTELYPEIEIYKEGHLLLLIVNFLTQSSIASSNSTNVDVEKVRRLRH